MPAPVDWFKRPSTPWMDATREQFEYVIRMRLEHVDIFPPCQCSDCLRWYQILALLPHPWALTTQDLEGPERRARKAIEKVTSVSREAATGSEAGGVVDGFADISVARPRNQEQRKGESMLDKLKNALIRKTLKNLLDGNKGTNALNAVLTPTLLANINFVLAFKGFQFEDTTAELELLKLVLIVLNGGLLYLIGKYPKVARWLKFAEDAAQAAEKSVEEEQRAPTAK